MASTVRHEPRPEPGRLRLALTPLVLVLILILLLIPRVVVSVVRADDGGGDADGVEEGNVDDDREACVDERLDAPRVPAHIYIHTTRDPITHTHTP